MDSAHLGEATIDLGITNLTVVFTIRARSRIKTVFGEGASLGALVSGEDPDAYAKMLAIGLAKYHPDLTAEVVAEMSIPLEPSRAALVKALNWSIFGPDGPPKAPRNKADEPENPQ